MLTAKADASTIAPTAVRGSCCSGIKKEGPGRPPFTIDNVILELELESQLGASVAHVDPGDGIERADVGVPAPNPHVCVVEHVIRFDPELYSLCPKPNALREAEIHVPKSWTAEGIALGHV